MDVRVKLHRGKMGDHNKIPHGIMPIVITIEIFANIPHLIIPSFQHLPSFQYSPQWWGKLGKVSSAKKNNLILTTPLERLIADIGPSC